MKKKNAVKWKLKEWF